MSKGYSYKEIMFEIPYYSLIMQLLSVNLPLKDSKEEEKKKEDSITNFFKTL